MTQDQQTKETLALLQSKVKEAFLIDPLLESVTLTLSWSTGNAERPFGLMIGRDGTVSSISTLIRSSQQTSKMLMYQSSEINEMFDAADAIAMDLAKRIKELKELKESNDASNTEAVPRSEE